MPSLALLYGTPPPTSRAIRSNRRPGSLRRSRSSTEYLQAVGGSDRIAKLTTLVAKGTYKGFDDAETSPLEIFASAPGQRTTIVHTLNGDSTTVVSSGGGWIAAPEAEKPVPLLAITGQELDGVRLEASLVFPGRVKQALSKWRVGPPALIDDRERSSFRARPPVARRRRCASMRKRRCSCVWYASASRRLAVWSRASTTTIIATSPA